MSKGGISYEKRYPNVMQQTKIIIFCSLLFKSMMMYANIMVFRRFLRKLCLSGQSTFSMYTWMKSGVPLCMMDRDLLPASVWGRNRLHNLFNPEEFIVSYPDYPVWLTAWTEDVFAKQRRFDAINYKHQQAHASHKSLRPVLLTHDQLIMKVRRQAKHDSSLLYP